MNETALELCPVASSEAPADEDEAVTEMDSDEETVPMVYPMSLEEAILGLEGHELVAASETEPSYPKTAVTLAKLEVLTIVACSLC